MAEYIDNPIGTGGRPAQAGGTMPMPSTEDLLAASTLPSAYDLYMRTPAAAADLSGMPSQQEPTAFKLGQVAYADDPSSLGAPAFVRAPDLLTLDNDAFGTKTAGWARRSGLAYGTDYVAGLNVFGRAMSREQLESSEAGRQLLEVAERNRQGRKRGFWEALTDFKWSDLPFVGMFATVAGSVSDAVVVSDTMKKLQNGEAVTDEELIKTRLYMAKQQYDSEGSWGAMVGDIIRAAPGFMAEMFLSGFVGAAVRGAAVRMGIGGTHLAMTRATKVLAREAVEEIAERKIAGAAAELTASKLVGTEAGKEVAEAAAGRIFDFMKHAGASNMYKGFTDDALREMARNRAQYELGKFAAREGGGAVRNGFSKFTQWLGQHASRGVMDFGSYGTEESTILFTRHSKAGRALADALGVFVVDAPLKGGLLMLPKAAVGSAVIAPIWGKDGRVVGSNQLSLQAEALRTDNRSLMDNAESIAFGMDLLEYISENTGRGLKSLLAAGGMGLERLGARGLVRPVARAVTDAGTELPGAGEGAFVIGGKLREFAQKVFGTREGFAAKVAGQEAELVANRLGARTAAERTAVKAAVMSGNLSGLSAEMRDAIGGNLDNFVRETVKEAYDKGLEDRLYKNYARYAVAKWMQKHNVGPETVMNFYNRMGYDGVFGEMFEERYSDVVKGLLGLDARADNVKLLGLVESPEEASFFRNLKEAVKGLYPGWEQLTAEAVGFMAPMASRGIAMRAMSAIGGGGEFAGMRAKLSVMDDAMRHSTVGEMTYSEAEEAFAYADRQERNEVAELAERREQALAAGDEATAKSIQKELDLRGKVQEERERRRSVYLAGAKTSLEAAAKEYLERSGEESTPEAMERALAKTTAETIIAVPLDTFGTLSSDLSGLAPVLSQEEARQVLDAQKAMGDFAGELARKVVEGQLPLEGENENVFRKVARRLVGIAGFMVTGDFSILSANPAQWTARDMGLSKNLVDALSSGFREELNTVVKENQNKGPEAEMSSEQTLDEAQRRFDPVARRIMAANLAVHQLRSFSDVRLREEAALQWAAANKDSDGRAWHYANGSFYKMAEGGAEIDETSVTSLDDMYERHGDEIAKVRHDILSATVDIMTRRLTGSDAGRNVVKSAVELDRRSDMLDIALYDAAMHMIGAEDLVYRVSLDGRTPLKAVMESRAVGRVSDEVVDYIVSETTAGKKADEIDGRAFESIAQALSLRFDGTEEGLRARNDKIVRLAGLLRMARREGFEFFSKEILDDEMQKRLSANGTSTLVARRQDDGSYVVDFGVKKESPKERDLRTYADREQLRSAMEAEGYLPDAAHVVLTQAKVVESSDMFWMIRELGLAGEYYDRLGERKPEETHPMLRSDADGNMLSQDDAERLLAEELAAAERGRGAAPGTEDRRAYDRLYGENGYMAVGRQLLADHGVHENTLQPFIGEFHEYAPSRYTYLMSAGRISPKSADVYVVLDPRRDADITSGVVNAILLDAYFKNGKLLRDSLHDTVGDFVADVRNAALDARAEAVKEKDTELVQQLDSLLRLCCDKVDRMVVGKDGKHELRRGIGLTPTGFTILANAFGLFRAQGDSLNPMLRAVATIAPRVWGSASFLGFESLLNVTLGGNYLDTAIWESKPGDKDYADPALTGVPRLMALATGNAQALRDAVRASLPAGLGYEGFLDAALQWLGKQSRGAEPVVPEEKVNELRARARAAAAPDAKPEAHFTFLGGLVSVLKATIDKGVTTAKSVPEFFEELLLAVENDPGATDAQRRAARNQLDYIRRRNDDTAAEEAYVAKAADVNDLRKDVATAEQKVKDVRVRMTELEQRDIATPGSVSDAQRQELQAQLADALAAKDTVAGKLAEKTEEMRKDPVPSAFRRLGVQANEGGGDTEGFSERVKDAVDAAESAQGQGTPEDFGDPDSDFSFTVANDPLGAEVPEVFAQEAMARDDGFRTSMGRPEDRANRRLTRRQAKFAATLVVRTMDPASISEGAMAERLRLLFPLMEEPERADVVDGFRALDALRMSSDMTWSQMVAPGGHVRVLGDDEKSDESTSSDRFNERAAAEYDSDLMRDFEALAARAAPETSGSIMGFVDLLRGRVRALAEGAPARDLLRALLCPQATPGLKSLAQADAAHKKALEQLARDDVRGTVDELAKSDPQAAFLLAYMTALPVNARTRFAGLCSGAVAATPVHVVNGVMSKRSSAPDGKVSDTLVTSFARPLVGMSSKQIRRHADALRRGVAALQLAAGGTDLERLRHNAAQVAELLATVFGRNNPLYTALTSHIAHRTWAADPAVAAVLLQSVSAGERGVELVNTVVSAMDSLSARLRDSVTRADVDATFVAAFTMGGWSGNVGLRRPTARMDVTDAGLTFLNMFQAGLPRTMMRSEIDQKRDRTDSSIVVAPRGMVPLLSRWLYQEGPSSFTEICRTFWPDITDETIAECRQDGTWPDDARTPICAKCLSSSLTPTEVYRACRDSFSKDLGAVAWVPLYSGDHSSSTILQIPAGVDVQAVTAGVEGHGVPVHLVEPGVTKEFDGHKIVWEKSKGNHRSFAWYNNKDGSIHVSVEDAKPEFEARAWKRPERSDPDPAGVINTFGDLIDFAVAHEAAHAKLAPAKVRQADGTVVDAENARDIENQANAAAIERLRAPAPAPLPRASKAPVDYKSFAKAVYKAIGMDLMFVDTKRSAISSLEAQGTGLVGVDSQGRYGEHRVHILHSWVPGASNEEFLGSTFMYGYGVRQVGNMSNDPDSLTKKVHVIGGAGRDLFFIKSLVVSQDKGRGMFRKGSAPRAVFDYAEKFRGGDALSTDTFTDDDSYKIGPGNSQGIRVVNGGKDTTVMGYVFERLFRRLVDSGEINDEKSQEEIAKAFKSYNRMTGDELDEAVGELEVKDLARGGTTVKMKLSEVMPGAMVNVFDGWSGPALDLSYREDSAMAYTVANVSHESRIPADPGRSPRNYEVDALAMVRTLAAGGWLKTPGLARRLHETFANWGLLSTAVFADPRYREALIRTDENLAELARNGEFVSPRGEFSGQHAVEEITRQIMAKVRQLSNLPLQGIDAPLVAAGASVDDNGNLVVHTSSEMERDMLKGSELFSPEEREFYGTGRRMALCNVNVASNGFRYGWFLDEDAVETARAGKDGLVDAAYRAAEADPRAAGKAGRVHALAIAWLAEKVRSRTRAAARASADERPAALAAAKEARKAFASLFVDHHGVSISKYGDKYLGVFGVEDLFVPRESGAAYSDEDVEFDLSAVQCEGQDLVFNDKTGRRHVFLGGTMFGLPRTPSYNGAPWLQTVRAGLPVTEIEVEGAAEGERSWTPGADAMVQPDPYTNRILGCDHDGDKSKLYMFSVNGIGDVQYIDVPAPAADADFEGGRRERSRLEYLVSCASRGVLEPVRTDDAGREVVVQLDDMTPESYFRVSAQTRKGVSNRFVRCLFALARQLPVDAVVPSGSSVALRGRSAPGADDGVPRRKFMGGVASPETSAFPGGKAAKKSLLPHGLPEVIGKDRTLGDPEVAAEVATSAQDAGDARGVMVSLARSLHMAWAFGMFPKGKGDLLGNMSGVEWLSFMHLVDGISNATFDDIKEQVCGRLGWTKGMMDSLLTEIMMQPNRIPVTEADFLKILEEYSSNVSKHGRQYWMLRSSNVADEEAHRITAGSLMSGSGQWLTRARLMEKLGLVDAESADGALYVAVDAKAPPTIGTALGEAIANLLGSEARQLVGFASRDLGHNSAVGFLYSVAVRGLHDAGMANRLQTERDSGARMFRSAESLTPEEHTRLVEKIKAAAKGMHLEKWTERRGTLLGARALSSSLLYLTADPGASNAQTLRGNAEEAFSRAMDKESFSPDEPGVFPGDLLSLVHQATLLQYDVGRDLYTCVSRAVSAALDRDLHVLSLVNDKSDAVRGATGRLLAKDTVPPYDLMRLRNNQQQVPLLAEFFTGAVDDILAGVSPGLTGKGVYDMLRRFAEGVSAGASSRVAIPEGTDEVQRKIFELALAKTRDGVTMAKLRSVVDELRAASAAAPNGRVAEMIASAENLLRDAFTPMTLACRAAVESMCAICYELMVTSSEFRDDPDARAAAFLRMADDDAFVKKDGNGRRVAASNRYGAIARDMRRIMPMFRANDQESLDKVRAMFDKVMTGRAFTGRRTLPGGPGARASFELSRKNLLAYAAERAGAKATPRSLEDVEKLGLPEDVVRNVRYAWQALGDDKTIVTPAVLFGAVLPAYTLMTSRMSGTPSAESTTLLNCLPERYYYALSSAEAMRRRMGDHVVPLMVGSDWSTETFQPKTGEMVDEVTPEAADDAVEGLSDDVALVDGEPVNRKHAKTAVTGARESLRGGPSRREPRANPRRRNDVDVFDPAFEAALGALREGPASQPGGMPRAVSASRLSRGAYDENVAKHALAMGALLGSWAQVEYNGGTVFTIRGDLRGDAGTGKAVTIIVDMSQDPLVETEEDVERLASSSAYAASLTEAIDLGLTAGEFLALPKSVRMGLVRKYGIGGATSGKVAWSVDSKGVATLVGRISLPAGGTKVYHEYFHSMMRMFESFGFFGKEDYEQLRATFGEDPSGRHQFNEERAAEAFRKWVEGRTDLETSSVRGVFQRILDFLKGLLEALKAGFSFKGDEGADTLFRMFVHGVAQPSAARLGEAKLEQTAAASAIRKAFGMPNPRKATTRALEDKGGAVAIGDTYAGRTGRTKLEEQVRGQERPSPPSNIFIELEDNLDYDMVDPRDKAASAEWEAKVLAILSDPDAETSRLLVPLSRLSAARRRIAAAEGADWGMDDWVPSVYETEGTPDFAPGDGTPAARAVSEAAPPLLVENTVFYRTGNAIRTALEKGLRESGAWTDEIGYVVRSYSANAPKSVADEALRSRAITLGLRKVLAEVNPEEAARIAGSDELEKSLAYRAALVMYQHINESYLGRRSSGAAPADPARHASMYQVSAWVMSTKPTSPADLVSSARARISELLDSTAPEGTSRAEVQMHLDMMDRLLDLVGDRTGLSRHGDGKWSDVCNDVIGTLRAGTRRPTIDPKTGAMRDIEPITVNDENGPLDDPDNINTNNPRSGEHLRTFFSSWRDRAVQESLKLALSTAYQVAAMAKYCAELDVHPAAPRDIAEARRLARLNGIPEHMSALEFLGEHLVGDSNLVDNPAYVDYQCQSAFIANNVTAWMMSMERPSDGDIGQMMSDEKFEYQGLVSKITLKENWIAHMLGVALEPGGSLLKVIRQKGEYRTEDGEVVRREGDEYVKFDNYGRKATSVKMTEEDLRRVDIWLKMCTAHANGQKHVVTGVDGLAFYPELSRSWDDYSIERVTARRGDKERMNPLEWAVWRMTRQVPPDLLPQVHRRLLSAAFAAMEEADRLMEDGTPGGPDGAPLVNDAATYNSFVIGELVRQGVVTGHNPEGSRHFVGGLVRYTDAALLLDCDEIDGMFTSSETYKKLTDEDKGARDKAWVNRDFVRREFMGVWEDAARFVKRHPWLTHGDGQFFHAFGTALPFWRGSGVFMYNAVRTDRANRITLSDKLSFAEDLLARIGAREAESPGFSSVPLSEMERARVVDDADTLARWYGAPQRGGLFLDAVLRGDYEFGKKASRDTGITLPANATYADLAHAIYQRAREQLWLASTGGKAEDLLGAENVIARYEDMRLQRGEVFGGSIGLSDLDMFRMHGTLPANYQIGHKVHKCIDGITNAMMSRATLANLLLTPEGATGAPVYYADPSSLAAEASGLPDAFWGRLAQWWQASNPGVGQVYDPAKSGVQNAKALYEKVRQVHQIEGKPKMKVGKLEYTELAGDDSSLVSVDRWMVLDGNGEDFMNATCGGEAMGYLRHFLDAGRALGFGGAKARACIQRALSWSKSLSVGFSFFFPLATRWESPIGAVGMLSTIGSNWKRVGDWMKRHPDAANALQGMGLFKDSMWVTQNYIGMKDILSMMDSNDPFLAEMYSWAAALGVTVSTSVSNPLEPDKTVLLKDIRRMKEAIRHSMGAEAAGKFARMMDVLMVRQGDKAFNYVLNATKLAVVAQICMKLRHQARLRGKAFDPIRDLRKYSRYINAEIGGIDPMRFAWAHPKARSLMNALMFSWQWTVGAWQAGGGSVVTDLITGSRTLSRQERQYLAGRWVRMFLGVMIAVPTMFQALTLALAKALGGGDDDDKWFTWENEDKTKWTAFDLTPLLKAMEHADFAVGANRAGALVGGIGGWLLGRKLGGGRALAALGGAALGAAAGTVVPEGALRRIKEGGGPAGAALGAIGGAIGGAVGGGNVVTSLLGAALGGGAGAFAPSLVPLYTGKDAANQTTHARRYYMHFGKQGWEFFRWFDDAKSQFFSKLSMPVQRLAEGVMGRSLGYLDRSLAWEDMGQFERWLSPTTDSALFNMAEAFLPFSVGGVNRNGDAGFLPIFGPVQMGASQTATQKRLARALEAWAANDRSGYSFGRVVRGSRAGKPASRVVDILHDAELNGLDPAEQLDKACGQVLVKLYGRLCKMLPERPGDDYDVREFSRVVRAINRVGGKKRNAVKSMRSRFDSLRGTNWKTLAPEDRAFYRSVVGAGFADPYGY